jgi:hypothetical protein
MMVLCGGIGVFYSKSGIAAKGEQAQGVFLKKR